MYVVVRDWDVDFSMVWDWVEGFFFVWLVVWKRMRDEERDVRLFFCVMEEVVRGMGIWERKFGDLCGNEGVWIFGEGGRRGWLLIY